MYYPTTSNEQTRKRVHIAQSSSKFQLSSSSGSSFKIDCKMYTEDTDKTRKRVNENVTKWLEIISISKEEEISRSREITLSGMIPE